jgi:hypothetical protein
VSRIRIETNADFQYKEQMLLFFELTFKTGLDFSAIDLRSSRAAFCATDVRAVGAGAKAAADPAKREIRASFMVTVF